MEPDQTYGKRLRVATRKEFKNFWSLYRNWATFATVFLVPVGIQIARHGWRSVINLDETLANGLIGLVASLAGTYFIAVWKGAEALDTGLRAEVDSRNRSIVPRDMQIEHHVAAIQSLNEKPKRTAAEEHHYAIAKAALEKIGPVAKPVLQHLALSGTLTFGMYNPPLPPGINGESTRTILNLCVDAQLVTRRSIPNRVTAEYLYEIAPMMKPALEELLYTSD